MDMFEYKIKTRQYNRQVFFVVIFLFILPLIWGFTTDYIVVMLAMMGVIIIGGILFFSIMNRSIRLCRDMIRQYKERDDLTEEEREEMEQYL